MFGRELVGRPRRDLIGYVDVLPMSHCDQLPIGIPPHKNNPVPE
jgi:hypothetical protein